MFPCYSGKRFNSLTSQLYDFNKSLDFSPSVLGWNKSQCGNVVSCVMVCEYINDPMHVKVRKGRNYSHFFVSWIMSLSFL